MCFDCSGHLVTELSCSNLLPSISSARFYRRASQNFTSHLKLWDLFLVVSGDYRGLTEMVQLLAMASGGLVLSLSLHSFYNNSLITGVLLVILSLPLLISATKKSLKLPPGPSGVPVLGYLPFLGKLPHQHMAKLAQKYGPLVHIQLGSFPGLVVSSPRLAKEVLMTQDQNFASHPPMMAMKYFAYYDEKDKIRRGIGSARLGAYFRNLRRLVALELMSPKRMQFLEGVRSEEMQRMVQSLFDDANRGEGNVNLYLAISAMTMNVISRTVVHKRFFGKDLADQKEAREFQEMFHKILTWTGHIFLADFVPSLHPVTKMLSSTEREMAKTAKRADAFLETILQEHRQKHNTEESTQDFVDMMLTSPGEDGKYLDDNTIKVLTLEIFLAGTDTPSVTIEWIMAELLRHPQVMQRLQDELDTTVGTTRHVKESDIANLPYLNAIVKETFRLHPVAPLLIPHESSQQTQIDGYDIPATSRVFINTWAMGRDPANWTNPTEFNPDRFMGQKKEIDIKGGHFELLAFGSGRRRCPGMPLGSLLVNLAIARLVHSFKISLPSGMNPSDLDLSESFGINLSMKVPLSSVRVAPRLRLDLYNQLDIDQI